MADYDALAAKFGASSGQDSMDALASKFGGTFSDQPPVKIGADAFPDTLRQVLRDADWGTRNYAGVGTALSNLWEGTKQLVGQSNQNNIRDQNIIRSEAPVGAVAGDMLLTALPFAKAGNSAIGAGLVGSGYGLTRPIESNNSLDVIKGKAINTGIGGAASLASQLGVNKLSDMAANRVSTIEQTVADKAAQVAASDTASARSAAGNAAQNAYRQLEHLRSISPTRAWTPEEARTAIRLEAELANKSLDNLLPAAAMKQTTSDAYKEAMATEAQRASEYAASKLSTDEINRQIMARVKRYGPAVAGGMIGNMIFPGLGGSVGGAATGLVLRPALRSMINLSKNPAVQHGLLSPVPGMMESSLIPTSSLLLTEGLLGR